jgi:hypothetical protein
MARRGVFVRAEEVAFLEEVRRWRQQCVLVLTRAKPQGPLYNATLKVIEAIDDVAEVVTGRPSTSATRRRAVRLCCPRTDGLADRSTGSRPLRDYDRLSRVRMSRR